MFNFFNLFKRRKDVLLLSGMNNRAIEEFIGKIEDTIFVVDEKFNINYVNKYNISEKYNNLFDYLEYEENEVLLSQIIKTAKETGFCSENIEIMQQKKLNPINITIYHSNDLKKYIVYIKDNSVYIQHENELKEKISDCTEEIKTRELFVANLSHEIKTPINIIVSMIYFLKETRLDEDQNNYVNKIENASEILVELVNNILNLTKSSKVNNVINMRENLVFNDLLENVYFMFKEEMDKKNIQWSVETKEDLNIMINEDKARLEQIFINLVSNAVKYTNKGYIELSVIKLKEDSRSYVFRFCIKDTGIGIMKENTIKIFKEFEQTTDPTIKEKEGAGLGLALVKKIIESRGGKIWVESSYGLGTKFFFELELLKANDTHSRKEANKADLVMPIKNINGTSNKILIVDDNSILTEVVQKVLSEMGIESDVAVDGMESVRLVEEKGIDYYSIILMDIHMPKYNGYDISRIMKEDLNVRTPIVALTATNITDEIIEENKNYIYSYIQKPVKPEMLKSIIKRILSETYIDSKADVKRETILFIADKINNWEILEDLNRLFNVICTVDVKDINIISSTKKLAAIIIDDECKELEEQITSCSSDTMKVYLKRNINEDIQQISLVDEDGYSKVIETPQIVALTINEMLSRKVKEENIDNTIKEYDKELSNVYSFLYDSLVNLTSIRSKETGAHLMRTQEYIKIMLKEYERCFKTGEFEEQSKIENIGIAATLHDIGKVGIPDEILNKPGRLTEEEYNKIKEHVIIGHQILENTSNNNISNSVLEYAKEITLHHHEKYDGTGYPDGQKGDEISTISRIMSIIDVYDALVNDRVYKEAMSYEEAEAYLISQSGISFDPKVVNVFMNVKEKLRQINDRYKDS